LWWMGLTALFRLSTMRVAWWAPASSCTSCGNHPSYDSRASPAETGSMASTSSSLCAVRTATNFFQTVYQPTTKPLYVHQYKSRQRLPETALSLPLVVEHGVGTHWATYFHAWYYNTKLPFLFLMSTSESLVGRAIAGITAVLLALPSYVVGGIHLVCDAIVALTRVPLGSSMGLYPRPGEFHIDWILYRDLPQPTSFQVIRTHKTTDSSKAHRMFPSDHFPVCAIFRV